MIPPKKDDHRPKARAKPARPERTIGKPSNVVATEEGVPGIPISMPDNKPPESPPTKTPIMVATPWIGLSPKVKGSTRITPIAIVKPGIDPAISPLKVPKAISPKVTGSRKILCAAKIIASVIIIPHQTVKSTPSGNITRKPKVKIAHIPEMLITEIAK